MQATSALDSITENSIQEALQALGKQRTVIVIAHRLSTIRHADQIIVMERGKVLEQGSHEQLLAIPSGKYRELWTLQREQKEQEEGEEAVEQSHLVSEAPETL